MCEPATIAMAVTIAATVAKGYADKQQGDFENDMSRYNARQLENDATRTRNAAAVEENKQRRFTAELIGSQKAQAAAFGVDINSGSPLQLQQDSALLGELDALQIRSNFNDKAQGLDDASSLTRAEGANAKRRGNSAFAGSILAAAGQGYGMYAGNGVAPKWYSKKSALTTSASGASANASFGSIA